MKKTLLLLVVFGTVFSETTNPFEIDFPLKKELSFEDYELAQAQLRKKEISSLVEAIYPPNWHYPKEDVIGRCSAFLRQTMIDREKGLFPEVVLIDGEKGSKDCIVTACSLDRNYPRLLKSLVGAIREVGFKGAIYYRIGGYPNPTGVEIRYAGTPYALKMFMIYEAYLLGYERVLWLDTSVWPLKNLDYCFQAIEKDGLLFEMSKPNTRFILPQTRNVLEKFCQVDLDHVIHCSAWLMGFKMREKYVQKIFEGYYKLVEKGTPFISVTPEEMVISALVASCAPPLVAHENLLLAANENDSRIAEARERGVRFILRRH
ncbi:MAG: hypothetical protein ACOYL1_04255 [Chlamydiia bacterium]